LARYIAPGHAGAQYVEDAYQRDAVRYSARPRVPVSPLGGREAAEEAGPQVIGHKIRKDARRRWLRWIVPPGTLVR
jgi:hypothetical protein